MSPAHATISPAALAQVLHSLPPRVARRLDAEPGLADGWHWQTDGDRLSVTAGEQHVSLPAGHVAQASDISCDCLLAPRCLHVAAVANALRLDEPGGAEATRIADAGPAGEGQVTGRGSAGPAASGGPASPAGSSGPATSADGTRTTTADVASTHAGAEHTALTSPQLTAARRAFGAGAQALAIGSQACGSLQRAELLQAAHQARLAGLHRLAAAAIRVADGIDRLARAEPTFTAAGHANDLQELLQVAWQLGAGPTGRSAEATELLAWIGQARRAFDSMPATMLHAIASERVLTATGYAGVVTHFVDAAGTRYEFGDVRPGGADQIAAAYRGTTRLGSLTIGHRQLGRSRLFAQGLKVSAEGRLGSGRAASATPSGSSDWGAAPLRALWQEPTAEQLARAAADGSLAFARLTTAGVNARGLQLRTEQGETLTAIPDNGTEWLLRLLAEREVSLWAVVRPLGPAHVRLLAIGPPPGSTSLRLPEEWAGRLMVGLDDVPAGLLPDVAAADGAATGLPAGANGGTDAGAPDPPVGSPAALGALDLVLLRACLGGRLAIGAPAAGSIARLRSELSSDYLPGAAALLGELHAAALRSRRDSLGEAHYPPATTLAAAWLRATTYVRSAATGEITLPGGP